jgi:hypothetical protein
MNVRKNLLRLATLGLLLIVALLAAGSTASQEPFTLADCHEIGFSTEEDFLTRAGTPADGIPIISDGDLLGPNGRVCARNRDLVQAFDVTQDLGLDAVDLIGIKDELVVFSTELDSPHGNFTAGDMLIHVGGSVPNRALLAAFGLQPDMGLDTLHFVGDTPTIRQFLAYVRERGRPYWVQNPAAFPAALERYGIDLWFSMEGTIPRAGAPAILDGDLLSARRGVVVYPNADWLAAPIPAGLPARGVDFGLDAFASDCEGNKQPAGFSSEILYGSPEGLPMFTDGDILGFGGAVLAQNWDLLAGFEPAAEMLGLDALTYPKLREECGQPAITRYMPLILLRRDRTE